MIRTLIFAILAFLATSFVCSSCTDRDAKAFPPSRICYASDDGRLVRSALLVEHESSGGEHLSAVTELRARAAGQQAAGLQSTEESARNDDVIVRLVEQAHLDGSGRLLRLQAELTAPSGQSETVVDLEPPSGRVEITTPSSHLRWSVPDDLPWVWVPMLRLPAGGAPVATPLLGRVTLRAAEAGRPVRRLDLGALTSHPMTADQLVVPDSDGRATVVAGDDAIDVEDGLPVEINLAGLGAKVHQSGPSASGWMLATAGIGCAPLRSLDNL